MCRPGEAWIGGDARDRAIMAASILAKVTRDAHMRALHEAFPHYGFDAHKGYSTPQHLAALEAHGPCPHHRRSSSATAARNCCRRRLPCRGRRMGACGPHVPQKQGA